MHPSVALSLMLVLAGRPVSVMRIRVAGCRLTGDAQGWGDAVRHLRGHGLLVETWSATGEQRWAAGPRLAECPWVVEATDEQRAAVVEALALAGV